MAGRLVLVTGASRGIGRAAALAFAAAGDRVVATARDLDALERLAVASPRIEPLRCDVTEEQEVARLAELAGPVEVLVCSAGISESAPLKRTSTASWQRQLDLNATAVFHCVRALLPGMVERDQGRIVTVASTAGHHGAPYTAAYTASKHAAVGLTRALASELAGSGVTANAVCPTFVRTEMTERSIARIVEQTGRTAEAAEQALAGAAPLGRLLEPDEVVAAIQYLASPQAASVNGQSLVLDGGGLQL